MHIYAAIGAGLICFTTVYKYCAQGKGQPIRIKEDIVFQARELFASFLFKLYDFSLSLHDGGFR